MTEVFLAGVAVLSGELSKPKLSKSSSCLAESAEGRGLGAAVGVCPLESEAFLLCQSLQVSGTCCF